jgi:hypothetical protein
VPDGRNRLGHIAHLHLQFLELRLQRRHPVGGAVVRGGLPSSVEQLRKTVRLFRASQFCWWHSQKTILAANCRLNGSPWPNPGVAR